MDGRGVQMKHALLIEYLSCFRYLEASHESNLSPGILFLHADLLSSLQDSNTFSAPRK